MVKAIIVSLLVSLTLAGSIYDIKVKSIEGKEIDFGQYKGKKLLIVNIATEGKYARQIISLEQLQQKYQNRLVVIAVPSNSFDGEAKEEKTIKDKLKGEYKVSYQITEKMKVSEEDKSALYQWLTSRNGKIKKEVQGDFQKYVVNEKGEMVACFFSFVDPMDSIVTNMIEKK